MVGELLIKHGKIFNTVTMDGTWDSAAQANRARAVSLAGVPLQVHQGFLSRLSSSRAVLPCHRLHTERSSLTCGSLALHPVLAASLGSGRDGTPFL